MTELNTQSGDPKHDDLDRALDAALARYAAVEPRPGLEGRVLAHLNTREVRSPHFGWWRWGVAAVAVAAIVLAFTVAWRPGRRYLPVAGREPVTIPKQVPSVVSVTKENSVGSPAQRPMTKAGGRGHLANVKPHPKLEQFPSPQPLSEEEVALVRYVRNFPEEARLIAHAQEEFDIQTQKEMNDAGSGSLASSSIQQER